ncbi:MAG: DUF6882 domain-containing protein [Flavobacterium sp.]
MGLFDNLFKKKEVQTESKATTTNKVFKSETEFLEKFGANALDKQRNLFGIIEERSWNVDMDKEEISFGEEITFPIQVLGSFSHSSETWLWIWNNKAGGYSESIMKQALLLKKYGEENEIDLLKIGKFDATNNDLHLIGMIASEMFNSSGYYLADYGQGIMILTIKSNIIDQFKSDEYIRIQTVIPELISSFEMNHKIALTNYLISKGYEINSEPNKLTGKKNEKVITAEFNDESLLSKLNG